MNHFWTSVLFDESHILKTVVTFLKSLESRVPKQIEDPSNIFEELEYGINIFQKHEIGNCDWTWDQYL